MNVLQPNKKAAIITLLTNGVSQREIERKVRVDRKTIRKYARITESKAQATGSISKSPWVATGVSSVSNVCINRRGRTYSGPCPISL
jgi:hypothetical protein